MSVPLSGTLIIVKKLFGQAKNLGLFNNTAYSNS